MIAQVILSILAGNDRRLPWLAGTNGRTRRQQMVLPPQIAIELSWIYLYGAQAGNVPEEEPCGGLVLAAPGRSPAAAPRHRVSSDYSWFWSPRLGSGYYDTRDSPARVFRMSLAGHRRLTPATGPNIADIESQWAVKNYTSCVTVLDYRSREILFVKETSLRSSLTQKSVKISLNRKIWFHWKLEVFTSFCFSVLCFTAIRLSDLSEIALHVKGHFKNDR